MMQSLGDTRLTLRCALCQRFWVRARMPDGGFAWEAVSEREARSAKAGLVVPARTSVWREHSTLTESSLE